MMTDDDDHRHHDHDDDNDDNDDGDANDDDVFEDDDDGTKLYIINKIHSILEYNAKPVDDQYNYPNPGKDVVEKKNKKQAAADEEEDKIDLSEVPLDKGYTANS